MSRDREYVIGAAVTVISAAALADHITDGVGSFPISAVFLGLGLILTAWSYRK